MVNLFYRTSLFVTLFILTISVFPQNATISDPVVSQAVKMTVSQPMRDLPLMDSETTPIWSDGIIPLRVPFESTIENLKIDGSIKEFSGPFGATNITKNFDGVGAQGFAPPDPSGDVGPNHYVQMVNVRTQIWDKNGNTLAGPFANSNFWSGLPGPWSSSNDGDPIVLYDETVDRWMVSQFALPNYPNGPFYILIAVSTTPDPTGTYYQYAFEYPNMPDYPKFGIWPDGYYMSANAFTSGTGSYAGVYATAFDRNSMLAGNPATMVNFTLSSSNWSFLPSDCDGAFPPVGSPNYFLATYSPYNSGNSNLDIYQFHVDWATPANSTFTGPLLLSTPLFSQSNEIPQLGTTNLLNNLADRPMNRLQYRNFGDHEAMVVCQTVNAGSGRAGMRWWELQKTSGNWYIYQENTYAPDDGLYRWMGSIAMDENGSIALGYSASSSTIYPDIRYTGRFASDPLGVMTIAETVIHAGGGSQTGTLKRWGDYTQMVVDPTEVGTFWYTNEYIPTNGTFNWKTRISAFSFEPPCPVGYASNPSPADGANDVSIDASEATWDNPVDATSNEFWFGTDPTSLTLLQSGSLATSFSIPPGTLEYGTSYFWRVDCANDTCSNTGPVWSFTTEQDPLLTVIINEDFESATFPPTGWTFENLVGTTQYWTRQTTASGYGTGTASSRYQFYSSSAGNDQSLITPTFSPVTVDGSLQFDHAYATYTGGEIDKLQLEYSSDGGTTWNIIITLDGGPTGPLATAPPQSAQFTPTAAQWATKNFSVPVGANRLKFRALSAFGNNLWVDNIKLVDIIPVELTAFEAKVSGNSVNLNWSTASELNNSGFEIQKKGLNNQFEKVGFVAGFGTTTESKAYSFTDDKVSVGNYTYRLKQVDFDGSSEYSNEINVDVKAPLTYNLEQNYPNPFNPSTLIKFSVAKDGFVNVSIFNLLGEKVATLVNNNMQAGSYEVNFNSGSLSSGVYFYSIEAGDFKAVRKMMLMK